MKVVVNPRYDGHFMVQISDIQEGDQVTELQLWLSSVYVWNFSGSKYFVYEYELPQELGEFLYSNKFNLTVENLCHDNVEIIKY